MAPAAPAARAARAARAAISFYSFCPLLGLWVRPWLLLFFMDYPPTPPHALTAIKHSPFLWLPFAKETFHSDRFCIVSSAVENSFSHFGKLHELPNGVDSEQGSKMR